MDICKKKQKKVDPKCPEPDYAGDAWIYTAIKRKSYLFVAFSSGKRTTATCSEMLNLVYERFDLPFPDTKFEIYTDGNPEYTSLLPKYYAPSCIDYGQIVKVREKGRVIDKFKQIVFGNPDLSSIETTDVENANGILRERIGRLVRKTKCYSKLKIKLESSLHLFQLYWNFMNNFKKGQSPGMIEGLIERRINWHEFLNSPVKY